MTSSSLLRVIVLATLGVLLPSSRGFASVDVRVSSGRVDIVAQGSPLVDVLRVLSQKIGADVVYEGPRPQMAITVDLRGQRPTDAIVGLLEGLGLSYVLMEGPAGRGVETLTIMASSTARSTAKPASPRASRLPMPTGLNEEGEGAEDHDEFAPDRGLIPIDEEGSPATPLGEGTLPIDPAAQVPPPVASPFGPQSAPHAPVLPPRRGPSDPP